MFLSFILMNMENFCKGAGMGSEGSTGSMGSMGLMRRIILWKRREV